MRIYALPWVVRPSAKQLRRANTVGVSRHARQFHGAITQLQIEAIGMLVEAAETAQKGSNGDDSDEKSTKRNKSHKASGGGNNGHDNSDDGKKKRFWSGEARDTFVKAAKTAVIMTSGFAMLGFAGMAYHRLYHHHTLRKMEYAFDSFDPVLEMSSGRTKVSSRVLRSDEHSDDSSDNYNGGKMDHGLSSRKNMDESDSVSDSDWIERPQQKLIDDIISGKAGGRYFVLLGEKGSGKTSMLLHALRGVKGFNVVVVDAHSDMEIFRQRLGKALNFEFYEDYWGGLFSLRGPRENTFLDIERVFNVLEEVAVRRYARLRRPLVLVINSSHLIPEEEEGQKLLQLLQQKAESLSGSDVATIVFSSDDYWLYQRLNRVQTRMDAISVADLHKPEALKLLRSLRRRVRASSNVNTEISNELAETIYFLVGGRPQFLAAVAEHEDMVAAAQRLIDREKQWFLNNCALLGPEMDDDVLDSGKFSVAGMKLAREFVRLERSSTEDTVMHLDPVDGTYILPRMPLWRARQVMARPDFMREYDNLNLFTLDSESRVKPDSVVMMHAFREVVSMPQFEELLEQTDARVSDIESLNRTREVTFKDLGGGGGKPGSLVLRGAGMKFKLELQEELDNIDINGEESDEDAMMLDAVEKFYWKRRLGSLNSGVKSK